MPYDPNLDALNNLPANAAAALALPIPPEQFSPEQYAPAAPAAPAMSTPDPTLAPVVGPQYTMQDIGTQTQTQMTPELQSAMGAYGNATQARIDAAGATLPEQEALAQQQSDITGQKANVYADTQARQQASNARFDAAYQKAQDEIAAKQQELEAASPKTFWAKADTGDKIGVALALMIGGAVSGKGQNVALTALNNAIDQDWKQQQANLDRKMKLLESKKLDAKSILDQRLRAEQDLAAYQLASLGQIDAKLAALEPKVKSVQQKQAIMDTRAKLDQDRAEVQLGIRQALAPKVETKLQKEVELTNASGGGIPFDQLPKDRQTQIQDINKVLVTRANAMNALQATVKQLEDPNLTEEQKYGAAQLSLQDLSSGLSGRTGQLTDADVERLAPMLTPNIGDIISRGAAGVGAGAVAGSVLPGMGNIAGGIIGGIGGAASAAKSGVRFTRDVNAYKESVKAGIEQIRHANLVSQRMLQHIQAGKDPVSAETLATKEVNAAYKLKKLDIPKQQLKTVNTGGNE